MNKLDLTKAVVNFAVGAGAARIVNDIVANNTNPETVYQKVTTISGAVVFGMMAKDATKTYTNAKIDEYIESYNKMKQKLEEAKKEKTA